MIVAPDSPSCCINKGLCRFCGLMCATFDSPAPWVLGARGWWVFLWLTGLRAHGYQWVVLGLKPTWTPCALPQGCPSSTSQMLFFTRGSTPHKSFTACCSFLNQAHGPPHPPLPQKGLQLAGTELSLQIRLDLRLA